MIRLVDGQVESFGRFSQLFDLYNRPVMGTGATIGGATGPDIAAQLQKLKDLKDQGVLSDVEFQKAKERLLNGQ
jgi:hypothetical protein